VEKQPDYKKHHTRRDMKPGDQIIVFMRLLHIFLYFGIFLFLCTVSTADIFPIKASFPVEIPENKTSLVTSMVENNAGGPLDTLTIRFYLAGAGYTSEQNQTVDMLHFKEVAPGAVMTSTRTVSLPDPVKPGVYTLWTESSGLMDKQRTDTQLRPIGTVLVIPECSPDGKTDLVAGGVLFPDKAAAGDSVQLTESILNTGDTATSEPFKVIVRLVNETAQEPAASLLVWEIKTIPGFGSGSNSSYERIPDTVEPGYYFLEMIIDPDGNIPEYSEKNNRWISYAPIHIIPSQETDLSGYGMPSFSVTSSVIVADT